MITCLNGYQFHGILILADNNLTWYGIIAKCVKVVGKQGVYFVNGLIFFEEGNISLP